jgi:hypothetical protein
MKRLERIALLIAAAASVGPSRAQTPSLDGGNRLASSQAAANVPLSLGAVALSNAGLATRRSEVRALVRFEGTFTQTRQSAAAGERHDYGANADHAITGRLVWTPDPHPAHPKTFGDVDSQFYVPTDGEIKVDVKIQARSEGGTCIRGGSETFAIRDLPPAALQNLYLEVAADGRYKVRLGMISYFLPVEAVQRCTFKVHSSARSNPVPINDVGVVIGPQQGVMTGDVIAGATQPAIVYGVHSYDGRWEFKRVD